MYQTMMSPNLLLISTIPLLPLLWNAHTLYYWPLCRRVALDFLAPVQVFMVCWEAESFYNKNTLYSLNFKPDKYNVGLCNFHNYWQSYHLVFVALVRISLTEDRKWQKLITCTTNINRPKSILIFHFVYSALITKLTINTKELSSHHQHTIHQCTNARN